MAFALCARDRIRVDGPFATPAFLVVLAFTTIVVLPAICYLYLVHCAWSWLYLVDPSKVPSLAIVPILVIHGGALIGGWYFGARLLRVDKQSVLGYFTIGSGVLFIILAAVFHQRLTSYGSYGDYRAGEVLGLLEVKLGYVLLTLIMGIGVAALFVVLELTRDSRRVRAR